MRPLPDAVKAIAGARARLVLGRDARSVFFASLALRLTPEADDSMPTAATDGRRLLYNPDFVVSLTPDELVGVLAHEVMHCALAHFGRRGARDPARWNCACDLAINTILLDAGLSLPRGRLVPGEGDFVDMPRGKSAEAYYAMLPPDGGGAADADPGGCGAVLDAADGSPAQSRDQESEWAAAVSRAEHAAKARGELPAGLARTVGEALHPPADWRVVLREFVAATARHDFSWSRPNRRFIAQGIYLPGLHSEELGDVVVAIDTSGSVGREELSVFAAEVAALLAAYDCTLTVVYHDARVQAVETWRSTEGPLVLTPVGGGGTSHRCVFDWLARSDLSPACVVCLTDLETAFPDQPPEVPVLWAVVGECAMAPPFGRRVCVRRH